MHSDHTSLLPPGSGLIGFDVCDDFFSSLQVTVLKCCLQHLNRAFGHFLAQPGSPNWNGKSHGWAEFSVIGVASGVLSCPSQHGSGRYMHLKQLGHFEHAEALRC